jgi:hypothetical protein
MLIHLHLKIAIMNIYRNRRMLKSETPTLGGAKWIFH